ncbi:hypothetical protein [Telmatospirillum sp.]|uniref:hypothetical protein n=1 Tax=Telmatospirillum sp. TaxID=2079197 RepID=UPI002848F8F7|nr:hypothetical protein [Telmatospirillum sp.]MDR3437553.1 hypothetical protein [Telmatospirillum sp.]
MGPDDTDFAVFDQRAMWLFEGPLADEGVVVTDLQSHFSVIPAKAGIHATTETIFGRRVIVLSNHGSLLSWR